MRGDGGTLDLGVHGRDGWPRTMIMVIAHTSVSVLGAPSMKRSEMVAARKGARSCSKAQKPCKPMMMELASSEMRLSRLAATLCSSVFASSVAKRLPNSKAEKYHEVSVAVAPRWKASPA